MDKRGGGDLTIFRRKFFVSLFCNSGVKNVGKDWDSNPYLALQNTVVLPTVPWEHLEFLTNVSEITKIYGPTEIRTRTYCLRNVCPNPTAELC